ncbi:uncharacterized protein [Dysidea avara]|uniref:uncharacterized protein isoform X2 n=1 Tax=Dysidea avara TaxID=196820 RepID=UPI00332F041C
MYYNRFRNILEISLWTATSCAPDIQSAQVFQRVVGRPLSLPCPLYHCNGEQVLEHYNMTTLTYDIINDGPHHLIGYNDEGSHRYWQRCNTTDRQYYYFIVRVIPEMAEVKIKFPPAVPYIGTCDACGDTRPIVNTSLNTEHCPHSIFITTTTVYTTQAALRIPSVTDECRGAILYCSVCQLGTCQEVMMELDIIEDTHPVQASDTDEVPTTTITPASSGAESNIIIDKKYRMIRMFKWSEWMITIWWTLESTVMELCLFLVFLHGMHI